MSIDIDLRRRSRFQRGRRRLFPTGRFLLAARAKSHLWPTRSDNDGCTNVKEDERLPDHDPAPKSLRHLALPVYVVVVAALATTAFGLATALLGSKPVGDRWPELVLFVMLIVVCEARPIMFARASGVQEIVASTAFTFALFLVFGPVLAMLAQAAASLYGDVFAKKTPIKTIFNFSQYWVAWGAATATFVAIAGRDSFGTIGDGNWRWSLAVVATATTYFVVNNLLVGTAIALATQSRIIKVQWASLTREAISDCVLLAFAPVVVIVADRGLLFLPLLLLPVYTVYRTARVSAEKEHQALHDPLTDLPNRASFDEALQRRMGQPRQHGQRAAVLLIDLDRFKEVNDTLGHQAGDELLRQIGPRLRGVLPEDATVSRFGGDEFAVLLPEIHDEVDAQAIGLRIAHAVEEPFRVDGFNLEVQASIGAALYPDHGSLSDELIKRADIAMYVAKRLQTGTEIYDPEQDHHSTRRLELVSELRKAILDGQIVLYYQPKLDLATGQVKSAEALVRWMHPRLGLVSPADFVPVAEHTGLIRPLTSHVLATAVRQAATWRNAGREIAIAVNLSARNLHDGGIITEVPVNLSRFDLPARLLRLEITESSIMADPIRARKSLQTLHDMGVSLSIDDFGTGYSSLAYLQNLPVSEIKIDRSFVMNLVHNSADQAIVRSTIELAKNLGLTSTAEGVETEEALEWLRRTGCDQAQGYHVARPMTAEAFDRWLAERDAAADTSGPITRQLTNLSLSPGGAGC
jgi:diguanylate cyclase (GGDEF)-like protein